MELNDFDYIDKLSPEEKAFLNSFCEGWNNADFRNKKTRELFKTVGERRECYRRNNARNRCVYTKAKASNSIIDLDLKTDSENDVNLRVDKNTTKQIWDKEDDELTPDELDLIKTDEIIKEIDKKKKTNN